MRSILTLLACAGVLSAQVQFQLPQPTIPTPSSIAQTAGQLSVVAAIGVPTTAPRHVAAAIGIAETVSAAQDFFLTVLESPQLNTTGATVEQTSVVLGMTQHLGTVTFNGVSLKAWGSAAFGTALTNLSKVNLSNTPTQTVASASTSASFTAQYVVGLGYRPPSHPRLEFGPVGRYIHVNGQPSQVLVGVYFRFLPK